VILETLTLEAGERGEVVLCPECDARDPRVVLEGTGDFVVEDVLLGNLPTPAVDVSSSQRGTWSAKVRDVLVCPDKPLKGLVKNTGAGTITLKGSLDEEND
jgi:hypothetical protein